MDAINKYGVLVRLRSSRSCTLAAKIILETQPSSSLLHESSGRECRWWRVRVTKRRSWQHRWRPFCTRSETAPWRGFGWEYVWYVALDPPHPVGARNGMEGDGIDSFLCKVIPPRSTLPSHLHDFLQGEGPLGSNPEARSRRDRKRMFLCKSRSLLMKAPDFRFFFFFVGRGVPASESETSDL